MKGTKVSRVSTQNEGAFDAIYKQVWENVQNYLINEDDVLETQDTISAYSLYNILKGYYGPLEDIMGPESLELRDMVDDINAYVANGYKVVGAKKSNKLLKAIDGLLIKIKDGEVNLVNGKKYTSMRFYIRADATSAVLDFIEDGKHKRVVVSRDLISQDLYYGKMSSTDGDMVDYIYDRLVSYFDLIDAYRDSLPEQIDSDVAMEELACRPYEYAKYAVPFATDTVMGEVYVNSNGYVDVDVNLTKEANPYRYINMGEWARNIKNLVEDKKIELLRKVPVNVESLDDPIKGIVIAQLADKRYLEKVVG